MTSTPAYPEDIMKAAEQALDNLLCNCAESCGGYAGSRLASIKDIARALQARDERAAKIADRVARNNKHGRTPESFASYTVSSEISAAIRNQTGEKP